VSLQQFDERNPVQVGVGIVAANTTTDVAIISAAALDTRIDSVLATNTDTIPHVVGLRVGIGGGAYSLGTVSVPAGAGTGGAPTVDVLASGFPTTQVGFILKNGNTLSGHVEVTMVGGSYVHLVAIGGTF
jgi:hypothetical protein